MDLIEQKYSVQLHFIDSLVVGYVKVAFQQVGEGWHAARRERAVEEEERMAKFSVNHPGLGSDGELVRNPRSSSTESDVTVIVTRLNRTDLRRPGSDRDVSYVHIID